MVRPSDGAHLSHELLRFRLLIETPMEHLDGHGEAVGEHPLVHCAEAAGAEPG